MSTETTDYKVRVYEGDEPQFMARDEMLATVQACALLRIDTVKVWAIRDPGWRTPNTSELREKLLRDGFSKGCESVMQNLLSHECRAVADDLLADDILSVELIENGIRIGGLLNVFPVITHGVGFRAMISWEVQSEDIDDLSETFVQMDSAIAAAATRAFGRRMSDKILLRRQLD